MLRLATIEQELPDDMLGVPIEASEPEILTTLKRPSSTTNLRRNFFYVRRVHNGSLGGFEVSEVTYEVT